MQKQIRTTISLNEDSIKIIEKYNNRWSTNTSHTIRLILMEYDFKRKSDKFIEAAREEERGELNGQKD